MPELEKLHAVKYEKRKLDPIIQKWTEESGKKWTVSDTPRLLAEINNKFSMINRLIHSYNQLANKGDKKKRLYQLLEKLEEVQSVFPGWTALWPSFRSQTNELFRAIQDEFKLIGVSSLEKNHLLKSLDTEENEPSPVQSFSNIIANLSPESIDTLLDECFLPHRFQKEKLRNLLEKEGIDTDFLERCSMELIHSGNSKVFLVTDLIDGRLSVLRIADRLNMPSNIEKHLRNIPALEKNFLSINAERQGVAEGCVRSIEVTDYCEGSDLHNFSKSLPTRSQLQEDRGEEDVHSQTIAQTLEKFIQMATIIGNIEDAGAIFLDMKIGNWMVDREGNLKIGDSKSFLFAKNGKFNKNDVDNRYAVLLTTDEYTPPELYSSSQQEEDLDVKKIHAYMFGKNFIQFLKGCDIQEVALFEANHANTSSAMRSWEALKAQLSEDLETHQYPEQSEIENIAFDLMHPDPESRPTIDEILPRLTDLQNNISHKILVEQAFDALEEAYNTLYEIGPNESSADLSDAVASREEIRTLDDPKSLEQVKEKIIEQIGEYIDEAHQKIEIGTSATQRDELQENVTKLKSILSNFSSMKHASFKKELQNIKETHTTLEEVSRHRNR